MRRRASDDFLEEAAGLARHESVLVVISTLRAQKLAARNGQHQIESEHLLLGLLEQENGVAPAISIEKSTPPLVAA